MSELRKDPIRGLVVVVAEERSRPVRLDASAPSVPDSGAARAVSALAALGFSPSDRAETCPLCPGHEAHTPPEVLAFRPHDGTPNDPRWSVRVVPSASPALRVEEPLAREGIGHYDRVSGVGAHEIIIETPAHVASLDELGEAPFALAAQAWQARLIDLTRDTRLQHALLYKNVGRGAGAALSHAHSQLVALPLVPPGVRAELAAFDSHQRAHERCAMCDLLHQELLAYARVVHDNAGFVVLAPFASRVPFELWVVPRAHAARFESIDATTRALLANALYVALRRTRIALAGAGFRLSLWNAPFERPAGGPFERTGGVPYHWRIEIAPALGTGFGLDLGAGAWLNPISPETAAQLLREVTLS